MRNIKFLSLVIIFSLSIHSYSQNSDLVFGIKAGANYSKYTPNFEINGREYVQYQRKAGFYLGGFLNFGISEKLLLQPELQFAFQGTDILIEGIELYDPNEGSTIYDIETTVNESTIAVPLVLRYYFSKAFFLEAGPQLSLIIDRSEKFKNNPFEDPDNPGEVSEADYDNFDLGLTVGTGYNLTEDLIINGRFFYGLLERDNNIKPSVFNLGLEYKL